MKTFLISLFLFFTSSAIAQQVDSIYVNLYTDSLKKGTHNYINIDGRLNNGRYLPLDSTHIIFAASDGNFSGNSLWVPPDFAKEKVSITATLRSNPRVCKKFDVYIKRNPDPAELKTVDEILNDMKINSKKKRG